MFGAQNPLIYHHSIFWTNKKQNWKYDFPIFSKILFLVGFWISRSRLNLFSTGATSINESQITSERYCTSLVGFIFSFEQFSTKMNFVKQIWETRNIIILINPSCCHLRRQLQVENTRISRS